MRTSLRNRILRLFLGLIFISSISTVVAVLFATNKNIEIQVRERLDLGHKVFLELLEYRGDQLIGSAELLTADFGFKSSVSAGDSATIVSTLNNHRERINADLMLLVSLRGKLLASTNPDHMVKLEFSLKDALAEAEEQGGLLSEVMLDGKLYQIVMVPVLAPVPIAWAAMGFEIDSLFADQLKELTHLDVTIVGRAGAEETIFASTFSENSQILSGLLSSRSTKRNSGYWMQSEQDAELIHMKSALNSVADYHIDAVLSESLSEEYQRFSPLRLQLLLISIFALIISMFGAIVISGNVTRPIIALVQATQRISGGNYSENISIDASATKELGNLASSITSMQDDIARREQRIMYQLYHDTLTDLPNRNRISSEMERLIRTEQEEQIFSVAELNINRFKQINDTFGFDIGDQLLQKVAGRLSKFMESLGYVARIGADEFAVVFKQLDQHQAQEKIVQLEQVLAEAVEVNEIAINLSVRCGLASFPEHGETADQLLRRANIALGLAKENKSAISLYQTGLDSVHLKKITMVNDLKLAMERDQLTMYFQPKLEVKTGQVSQVEALIRWIHPEMGFISPGEFIPVAEQSGLMPELTRWVIQSVVGTLRTWRAQGVNSAAAINLSAYDLTYASLPADVMGWLNDAGLTSQDLMLEVTESAVMDDPEFAVSILQRFKEMGFSLSIDDYGTGYSSLSQLKKMPVDELKIDMSFVRNLDCDVDDQVIVKSTIEMAHNIGLTVVAEGVETANSWGMLAQWGCNKLQGFYISKPLPNEEFIQWMREFDLSRIAPKAS